MPLVRWLGSLSFTVVICVLMIICLVISTTMESHLGTEFAQKIFYQARWFDVLLSLFWINIFCSTALRYPFQRGHLGFIITHVGILMLLVGSLMARIGGVEGRITLFEGETTRSLTTGAYRLSAQGPDGVKKSFVLSKDNQRLDVRWPEIKARIGQMVKHAQQKEIVTDGGADHPVNHAIHVRLNSSMMGMKNDFWLIEDSPINPDANVMILGPAHIMIKPKPSAASAVTRPTLKIQNDLGQDILALWADEPQTVPVNIADTGRRIENLVYYPRATVKGKDLVNAPEDAPENPAVSFDVVDANGARQRVIKFALFPDFESMHTVGDVATAPVKAVFQAPAKRASREGMSTLTFYYGDDGWTYESILKDGQSAKGDVQTGVEVMLGWADMTFEIVEAMDRAEVTAGIVESPEERGPFAVELVLREKGKDYVQWLMSPEHVRFTTQSGDYRFSLAPETVDVPFALTLNDFKKTDYPGTMAAAAYESDVTLEGIEEDVTIKRVIQMNKPLDYKGYRIFQSSFIEDSGNGEGSIFTVAKNPGIPLIYLGSCVLFLGAAYQFYGPKNGGKKDEDVG